MKTPFDVRVALCCISGLALAGWLMNDIPTLVAGLIIGLSGYCFMRLKF